MSSIYYYMSLILYPLSLALFIFGSYTHFIKTRNKYSLFIMLGFSATLIGNLLQNYGPNEVTYTETGAIIEYTIIFTVGRILGQVGFITAAISFVMLMRSKNAT